MNGFWNGRKVLVTGADGFIGSHLVERLVAESARVRAFVYYNSFGRAGWLDDTGPEFRKETEIFAGDIRDAGRVEEAVKGQEVVFHLASLIGIPYSYVAPQSYVETNIGGALNVLNACRKHGVHRLVHTSTSEVYGTAQYVPIDEKHPLQGQSPYSASKIGADMLAESYFRSFDVPVVIARPFNTYGPRQSARAVIPTVLSQIHSGAEKLKLGSIEPRRDFNFVSDTVSGFLGLAQALEAVGRVVNIGSGRDVSIGELVAILCKTAGRHVDIITDKARIRPKNSEVDRLLCDSSLAKRLTRWQPEFTLEQGIEITSRWIKDHLKHFDVQNYAV